MSNLYKNMQYKPMNGKYNLTNIDREAIFQGSSEEWQNKICLICSDLEAQLSRRKKEKDQAAKAMFGIKSSMEVLSKVGMFLMALDMYDGDLNMLHLNKPHVMQKLLDAVD